MTQQMPWPSDDGYRSDRKDSSPTLDSAVKNALYTSIPSTSLYESWDAPKGEVLTDYGQEYVTDPLCNTDTFLFSKSQEESH